MPEFVPGIVIDPETRSFEVNGRRMVVGNLCRSPFEAGHWRDRTKVPPAIAELIEEGNPGFYDRFQSAMPESIHATLLCGENGWWVEVAVWPGDPEFDPGMCIGLPDEPWNADESRTADELLAFWLATCQRRDAPPPWEQENDPGPFGGMAPGTWFWPEDDEDD